MEYFGRPVIHEDEDDEEEVVPIIEPGLSFYEKMQAMFNPESEEDDEEDDKKKKQRSFRDWFRGRGIAHRSLEEQTDTDEPKEKENPTKENPTEGLSSLIGMAIESHEPVTVEEPDHTPDVEAGVVAQTTEHNTDNEPAHEPQIQQNVAEEAEPDDIDTSGTSTPPTDVVGGRPPIPPNEVIDSGYTSEVPPEPSSHGGGGEGVPVAMPARTETGGNISLTTTVENNSHNVAPAIVGSLIVDQLSRHRDRKIRKEAEALKQRLERAEDSHDQTKTELRQENDWIKKNVEQQKASLPRPEKIGQIEKTLTGDRPVTQTEKVVAEKHYPEVITSPPKFETTRNTPESPNPDRGPSIEQRPEVLPDNSTKGETYFDSRHELKDKPGAQKYFDKTTQGGASHQQTTFAQDMPDLNQIKQSLDVRHTPISAPAKTSVQPKTAALVGLATAVVIIAIVGTMMLLF